MLRDMEQLVISIKDYEIRNYMAEALRCYHTGSYRACVILSFVAGIYDLKNKIKTLADSVNEATILNNQIDKKIENQDTYEQDIIDGADKAVGIISPHERKALMGYKDARNSCAHPGGHQSSAEEARNVFTGIYDILLSKPAKVGFKYEKELLNQIKSDVLFPDPQEISVVSEKHFNLIYASALPTICHALIKVITNQTATPVERTNAAFLVAGFSIFTDKDTNMNIQRHLSKLLEDAEPFQYVIKMLKSNIEILSVFERTDHQKIITRFKHLPMNGDTSEILNKIIQSKILEDQDVKHLFTHILGGIKDAPEFLKDVILENYLFSSDSHTIVTLLSEKIAIGDNFVLNSWRQSVDQLNSPDIDRAFTIRLIGLIENNNFDISNSAIKLLLELSDGFIKRVSDKLKVSLVLSVLSAARINGYEASNLISNGFSSRGGLLPTFSNYIKNNNLKIVFYKERDASNLIKLFNNSNQLDVLEECLGQLKIENGFTKYNIDEFIIELKRYSLLESKRKELESYIDQMD